MTKNIEHPIQSIWFILGLAGTGKSFIGEYAAAMNNWFHLELDQGAKGDGIDLFKIRYEWDLFFNRGITEPLTEKLFSIYTSLNCNGAILTFSSRYVLSREHIEAINGDVKIVYLYGSKKFCMESFLRREIETGRGLDSVYWRLNNEIVYELISDKSLQPYRVNVFDKKGKRKDINKIIEEIVKI